MSMKRNLYLSSLAVVAFALVGFGNRNAEAQKFELSDPKKVSGVTFTLDSQLEPLVGQSSEISGELLLNAAEPAKSTGKVVVATKSVTLAGAGISAAAQQDWCLAPETYPTIEFKLTKIENVKTVGTTITADVTGDFTLHGVTKPVTATAKVTPLPGLLKNRGGVPGKEGDLVKIDAKFSFDRTQFKLATNLPNQLVANQVDVHLLTIGVSIKN